MALLKFICGLILIILGFYIGSKEFYLPNASACDLCFGVAALLIILGLTLLTRI